jgi:hypothetical protein
MKKKSFVLPKSWTTVTPFSKALALALFVLLPVFAFHLGKMYEKETSGGFCAPVDLPLAKPAYNK